MSKILGEMTPDEQAACIAQAVCSFQDELDRTILTIAAVLNEEIEETP